MASRSGQDQILEELDRLWRFSDRATFLDLRQEVKRPWQSYVCGMLRKRSIKRVTYLFHSTLDGKTPTFTKVVAYNSESFAMGIDIEVVAGKNKAASSVNVSGSIQHVITDQERKKFGLNDTQLKEAVAKYFGKEPNDAFLHSPTPWNDLYKRYDWQQVTTVMAVESGEILGFTSEPVVVKTTELSNRSSISVKYDASINDSVKDTTSTNWNTGGEFISLSKKLSTGLSYLAPRVRPAYPTPGHGEKEVRHQNRLQ